MKIKGFGHVQTRRLGFACLSFVCILQRKWWLWMDKGWIGERQHYQMLAMSETVFPKYLLCVPLTVQFAFCFLICHKVPELVKPHVNTSLMIKHCDDTPVVRHIAGRSARRKSVLQKLLIFFY